MTDVECRPAKVGLDRSTMKAAIHRPASRSLERCSQDHGTEMYALELHPPCYSCTGPGRSHG